MSNGRKCGEGGHLQSSKGEAHRAEPKCSCGLKKQTESGVYFQSLIGRGEKTTKAKVLVFGKAGNCHMLC